MTQLSIQPRDRALVWRPYANPRNIIRLVDRPEGRATFVVDPWTQRWAVLGRGAERVLTLADGTRTVADIVARTSAETDVEHLRDPRVVESLIGELRRSGLVFTNTTEHTAKGKPIFFATEPLGIHLEITNACNLSCAHCYVSSGVKLPNELGYQELVNVVDQLEPFAGKLVAITGGEAAVRKNCMDLVEYCAVERGHNVDLYTNAYKFPRKFAERIVDLNELTGGRVRLQVSLEGATARTNDMIRGSGVYDRVLETLGMFRELGLNRRTQVLICITRHNIHEIDAMIEIAERYDIAQLVFSQWQRQGNASDTPWGEVGPETAQWVAAGERVLAYADTNSRTSVVGNFFGDLNNGSNGRYTLEHGLFPKHLFAYNAFPRISPDGWIFADQLWVDDDWALGNVRDMTLEEAFASDKFRRQIAAFEQRARSLPECASCEWLDLCGGGHPGHTLAEYGDLNHKDVFCDARQYWFERFVDAQLERTLNGG